MNIKKIALPFSEAYSFLGEKWWHRFFVVVYVIVILVTFGIAAALSIEGIEEKPYNINIKNNLRDFSKNSDTSVSNTVPLFLKQGGSVGCLEDNRIKYVSAYALEEKTFCSADIPSRLDDVSQKFIGNDSSTVERRKELLSEMISKDSEKRYCFISNEIDCSSDKVVSYSKNTVYYLQVIAYSLISVYLVSLFLQVLYYKGFIYIVYGKNK